MKTQNREEIFLKALADGKEPEIKPLTRKEILLKGQSKRESEGPHWDDLEGKPFGGYKFTWDGNTEGKDTVLVNGGNVTMCKVSDEIVTPQDLDGAKMTISDGEVIEVSSADFSEKDGAYTYKNSFIALIPNAMTVAGLNFPSGGVYFMKLNNVFHVAEVSNLQTIDPKYLPICETVGSDTLTWDGNTEGLEFDGEGAYKVTDTVPSIEELSQGGLFVLNDGFQAPLGGVQKLTDNLYTSTGGVPIIFCLENGVEAGSVTYNKGIYLPNSGGLYISSLTINGYTGFTQEKIKEEYLPTPTELFINIYEGENVYTSESLDTFVTYEQAKTVGRNVVFVYKNNNVRMECSPIVIIDNGDTIFYKYCNPDNAAIEEVWVGRGPTS